MDPGVNYMNPTFWDDIPVLLNGLTAFLASEEKMMSLFQGRSTDLWEMAEALTGYGCEIIVIKRGSRGQLLYNGGSRTRWILPAYPVQIVNPSGAGDAFCGGFLAGYRSNYDPLEAALAGNISAALVIEGTNPFYTLEALPGLARARMDALRDTVRKV
jgi:ribokinase